jgi:hypothetical protein
VLLSPKNVLVPKTGCSRLLHLFLGLLLLPAITLVAKPLPSAEVVSLDEAIRQLAERIAAIPNLKGPLRLEIHEDAYFDATEGQDWKVTLRRELDRRQLSITEESAAPLLRVGATQTPRQIVLAAELLFANGQEFRVLALNRVALQSENLSASPVRVGKQLLFESPERILDVSSATTDDLIVLTYRNPDLTVLRIDPAGTVKQSLLLSAAAPPATRDPRAELIANASDGQLQLPGKVCEFTWTTPADVKCRDAKSSWRAPPALASPCDSNSWKLQTDSNDWTAGDLLQVFPEDTARPGSVPLLSDFPGPILGMNSAQNSHSALAVVRNLRTGNYEVYNITLACGN